MIGKYGANDMIRKKEKHVIDELEKMAVFLDDLTLNVNRCRDYYRLRTGGTYDDEVVVKTIRGVDIMEAVPTVKQKKEKANAVHRKELIDNIDELVLYFKRDIKNYNRVDMGCNMDLLDDWLKEEEK